VDDGAVFYLNGAEVGRFAADGHGLQHHPGGHASEPALDVLMFQTGALLKRRQRAGRRGASDDVLRPGSKQRRRVRHVAGGLKSETNVAILTVVLNEVLAKNLSVTNAGDTNVTDWVELYNPSAGSLTFPTSV